MKYPQAPHTDSLSFLWYCPEQMDQDGISYPFKRFQEWPRLQKHRAPQKSIDSVGLVQIAQDSEPNKAAVVPVNIHAIGEASPLARQLFGSVSASLCGFLKILSHAPFILLVTACFAPTSEASAAANISAFLAVLLTFFFLLASIVQLFACFFLMWTAKNLLLGTVKDGIWPIWGWKMACLRGIRLFEDYVFALPIMLALERTEMPNFVWRLMGSHVGRGAYICHSDDLPLIAWDLLSIGEDATLDGMNICGSNHTFHFHRPLSIGSGCAAWMHYDAFEQTVLYRLVLRDMLHCYTGMQVPGANRMHCGQAFIDTLHWVRRAFCCVTSPIRNYAVKDYNDTWILTATNLAFSVLPCSCTCKHLPRPRCTMMQSCKPRQEYEQRHRHKCPERTRKNTFQEYNVVRAVCLSIC